MRLGLAGLVRKRLGGARTPYVVKDVVHSATPLGGRLVLVSVADFTSFKTRQPPEGATLLPAGEGLSVSRGV